ncbi:hypothetical protein [Roseibium album]|uniref:hypothetical protein n=1 Tax=Roseibium album TaxID=311410 RepID=UPI00391C4DA9
MVLALNGSRLSVSNTKAVVGRPGTISPRVGELLKLGTSSPPRRVSKGNFDAQ